MRKYYYPSPIPVDVVEHTLKEIEDWTSGLHTKLPENYAYSFAYTLQNMLVCGTVKDSPNAYDYRLSLEEEYKELNNYRNMLEEEYKELNRKELEKHQSEQAKFEADKLDHCTWNPFEYKG